MGATRAQGAPIFPLKRVAEGCSGCSHRHSRIGNGSRTRKKQKIMRILDTLDAPAVHDDIAIFSFVGDEENLAAEQMRMDLQGRPQQRGNSTSSSVVVVER